MTAPLERYGLIGDGESAALVCDNGSIDWLCWPRFNSDACFAALVGREEAGYWRICPHDEDARCTQRYRDDTLLLETDFVTACGAMRVLDVMPLRDRHGTLIRRVIGLRGEVTGRMEMRPRFGYGSVPPWAELQGRRFVGIVGPDLAVLYSGVPLERDGHDAVADFTLREGQSLDFVLRFGTSTEPPPQPIDVDAAIDVAERYWRDWIGKFDKPSDWPEALRRSLLTLKALVNRPSGGVLAAASCSLPEVPGGAMNWDYRYCWLRDSTFCLAALLNAGYVEEAQAWRDWLLRTVAGSPEHIQIMYRLDGGRELSEWQADWLAGYAWSRPVRVGNAAARQRQIDVYGELVDAFDLAHRAGIEHTEQSEKVERALVERLNRRGASPVTASGSRAANRDIIAYSKVMAWVGSTAFSGGKDGGAASRGDFLRRIRGLRERFIVKSARRAIHPCATALCSLTAAAIDASLLILRCRVSPDRRFARERHGRAFGGNWSRTDWSIAILDRTPTARRRRVSGVHLLAFRLPSGAGRQRRRAPVRTPAVGAQPTLRAALGSNRTRRQTDDRQFSAGAEPPGAVNTALGLKGEVYQRGGG